MLAERTLQGVKYVALMFIAGGCSGAPTVAPRPTLFESLPPESTGVTFANRLPDDTAFNMLSYLYYYDGGGVAVGDVNNDGLPDLYFTSNVGSNRLYLNRGNYHFEDVTARAGVADSDGWKTGVTMADVNGDGYVDIYVSGVNYLTMHGRNVLFINKGDGTFTDRTNEYGLDHVGYGTQALFFDYDGDGDLDMYMLNHSVHAERARSMHPQRVPRNPRAGDRLYRNDGGEGHFVDVSDKAHIYGGVEGYGLGVVASDLDGDGCPDLYVANDFQEDDFLYHNNCDGTFTESIAKSIGHTSHASMGVDAADFNNDGRPDLVVADMLPDDEKILKTSENSESWDIYNLKLEAGYQPQYARNTLQLNRGHGRFSEIGYLAGVYATDWSWAPLFADLDNDGYKDLFVTAGIYRRPNDLDYLAYVGTPAMQAALARDMGAVSLSLIAKMPHVPIANAAFHNNANLTFTNMAGAWGLGGLGQLGFSNGAVYVDLNNSGALDLVVNKIDAPAAIYRNRARSLNGNHYLQVVLRGSAKNTAGIGTKVILKAGATTQLLEQMPTRGFESSVDPRLHFGTGHATQIDSLTVIWPDRRYQVLTAVNVDRTLRLSQNDARGRYHYSREPLTPPLFSDVTDRVAIDFRHHENAFYDYQRQPLIPHLLSTEGPALAVGDVNGDGLDDFYAGGAKWQPGRLFIQNGDGTFRASKQPAIAADSLAEDVDAVFVDADGDGHPDLYVVSGGNELWGDDDALQDRLYRNDGNGNFQRDPKALPRLAESGSCVLPGDFNGDGHVDLFVGRRAIGRGYGLAPRSYLLENDGAGHFRDVTQELAPALANVGMVTSAAWVDYDHDGKLDLIVVGEWMPIRIFHQENGHFVDRTTDARLGGTDGWWNTIQVADLDADGRPDLILGNLGLNSTLRASADEPARLYVGDFFQNGTLAQILTSYKHGVSYPLAERDELLELIPQLRSRYPTYASFAGARVEDMFSAAELRKALLLESHTFASAVALNRGDGHFELRSLPTEAQFAPIYATLARDFDGDGHPDLLVAGNLYGVTPLDGRYDASYGLLLHGDGNGNFAAVDVDRSGLDIDGQVRHMAVLKLARGETLILVARNNDRLQVIRARN